MFLRCTTLLLAIVALGLTSCDKVQSSLDDAKKAVTGAADTATQTVENVTETVKQTTGNAGTIEIKLNPPITAGGCYAAFYKFSDKRPSVLQLTSYNEIAAESFPSCFVRAIVEEKSAAELAGKKIPARVFLQTQPDGPVWQSPDDKPVELSVTKCDDATFSGEISGTLLNCETGDTQEVTGTLNGSFKAK